MEELEELRADVEGQVSSLSSLREATAAVPPLQAAVHALQGTSELQKEVAAEQLRARSLEAERDVRVRKLEEEVRWASCHLPPVHDLRRAPFLPFLRPFSTPPVPLLRPPVPASEDVSEDPCLSDSTPLPL